MDKDFTEVRFYYGNKQMVKATLATPLAETYSLPIFGSSEKKYARFIFHLEVINKSGTQFIVYRQERHNEKKATTS